MNIRTMINRLPYAIAHGIPLSDKGKDVFLGIVIGTIGGELVGQPTAGAAGGVLAIYTWRWLQDDQCVADAKWCLGL